MKPLTHRKLGHAGLGNSLHEIAGTVGIARSMGRQPVFDPTWPYRPFLSMPDDWFSPVWEHARHGPRFAHQWWCEKRWVDYLQHPPLWADCADEIRAAFQPSARAQAVLDGLPEPGTDDVAVHVRMGDYATYGPDFFPRLDAGYYRRAAALFPGASFDVFTDDPAYALSIGLLADWQLVGYGSPRDPETDWADLFQMARYRHHIISGSSFGWWSAFLSGDDHVCYPDPFYGEKIVMDTDALMMPGWRAVAA